MIIEVHHPHDLLKCMVLVSLTFEKWVTCLNRTEHVFLEVGVERLASEIKGINCFSPRI